MTKQLNNPGRHFLLVLVLLFIASGYLTAQDEAEPSPMAEQEASEAEGSQSEERAPDFDKMSARDFFALIDFGDSYLQMFLDGQPLEDGEQEAVIRALTRIRRLQPHRITRWLKLETPWQDLEKDPQKHRLEIYLLTGNVEAVREITIPKEAVASVGLAAYYEVDALLDTPTGKAFGTIVVEDIPHSWKVTLNPEKNIAGAPISCAGVFLKPFKTDEGRQGFVFATPKISWHPSEPNQDLGVTADQVLLAEQGMDIGELSRVKDRVKFEGLEREPFYQMMAAVRGVPLDQQKALADLSVSQLLTEPKEGLMVAPADYRARFMRLTGLCRRITKIEVDDEDIQQRLGVDHYYELSVFVPIANPIVSQRAGDESTRKQFSNDYPVLVCVAELPPGLSVGEDLHQSVAVTGAFFKLWAYRTPFMSQEDFTRRQISPLFIAANVEKYAAPSNPETNQFVLAMLVVLGVVVGLGIAFGFVFGRKPASRKR
ncbi:hypothetical protein C5Y96_19820 [Blastopirellula marina]|uniref:DUF2330 domain-containing protein n=1 Tax=Blastopirellula marina TaxID=124 RepID=A0A2S8F466_9BACT|nr:MULTISPECIES: hypothetical protein [Pirellulaceae]PQO26734.1 hypothetical protein C5Y96_19820 [Blastopirellula marina]RCS46213.1 hypothetical protein DTL36_19850 [Bremerella cremea]